ncbi:MAG: 4Fe-4S binding protein [Chloroflexi bacterium]|nr:4Fe-4S binding protein [Chloroflexota bacterium]
MPPVVDPEKCTLCGICEDVCPGDLLFVEKDPKTIVRYPDECNHCGICEVDCPEDAIVVNFPKDLQQPVLRLQ